MLGLEASECVYKLLKWSLSFLQSSSMTYRISNQLRGSTSWCQGPGLLHLIRGVDPLFVREDSVIKPFSSESLVRAVGPDQNCLSFPHPYQILCISFFTGLLVDETFC